MKKSIKPVIGILIGTAVAANAAVVIPSSVSFSSQISFVDRLAANTIDGSGLTGPGDATSTHGNNENDGWITIGFIAPTDYNPSITFNLAAATTIALVNVWNYNELGGGIDYSKHGFRNTTIAFSTNGGGSFTDVWTGDLTRGTAGTALAAQSLAIAGTGVTNVRFTAHTNWDGDNFDTDTFTGSGEQFAGLAEVRFDTVPEPSVVLLGGVGVLGLFRRRR